MISHFRTMLLLGATVLNLISCETVVLDPLPGTENSTAAAIIWIHGMECDPQAYKTFA
jgi:hypothetical protein